jgi:hypothetical protein
MSWIQASGEIISMCITINEPSRVSNEFLKSDDSAGSRKIT